MPVNQPRSDAFVSVVAPVRDEVGHVSNFVKELYALLRTSYANFEIIVVDDGSTDGTDGVLRALLGEVDSLRVLRLSRSFGREATILAGLESSIGDYIVVMLAECDPVELIPTMVERCRRGASGVVGIETNAPRRSWPGRLASIAFHWYCRKQLHLNLYPGSRYFRVFSRSALNAILQIQDRIRNLRHLSGAVGFEADPLPYQTRWRVNRRPRRLSKDLSEGLSVILSNSKHPLRFITDFGLIASGINLIFVVCSCFRAVLRTSTLSDVLVLSLEQGVLFFLLFIILAVLAEYIGFVLWETRARPSYFISREESSMPHLKVSERRNVVDDSI